MKPPTPLISHIPKYDIPQWGVFSIGREGGLGGFNIMGQGILVLTYVNLGGSTTDRALNFSSRPWSPGPQSFR